MRRTCLAATLFLPWAAGPARAQFGSVIGPGSTPAGDYLRGVGIEAAGMGQYYAGMGAYNLDTAMAESIHVDSTIRFDQYLSEVFRYQRARYAALKRQARERFDANYAAIRQRITEHPEAYDVMPGNALNAVLDQLNDPAISPSAFRSSPARVDIDDIRRIRFRLGEKAVEFTMQQLTVRGKGKWPVAFQDGRYAAERKAYARGLDEALEHMVSQDMPEAVIIRYEAAVNAFAEKLRSESWAANNWLRIEANAHVHALRQSVQLLKIHQAHAALAELDSYSGTTVNDLRLFMQRHNLQFGAAATVEERELYPRLFASFVAVRESVGDVQKGADR